MAENKKTDPFSNLDLPEPVLDTQSFDDMDLPTPVTPEQPKEDEGLFSSAYEHLIKRPSIAVAQGMADTLAGDDSLAKLSSTIESYLPKSITGTDKDKQALQMMEQADIAAGKEPVEAKGDIGLTKEQQYQKALEENKKLLRGYEKTSQYDVPLVSDVTGYQLDTSKLGKMLGGAATIEAATTAAASSLPALAGKYGMSVKTLIDSAMKGTAPIEVQMAVRGALGFATGAGLKTAQTIGEPSVSKQEDLKKIPLITDATGLYYDPGKMNQIKTAGADSAAMETLMPIASELGKVAVKTGKGIIKGLQKAETPTLRQMGEIAEEGYKYPSVSDSSREAQGIKPSKIGDTTPRPAAKALIKENAANTLYDEFDDISKTVLNERDNLVKEAKNANIQVDNTQLIKNNDALKEIMGIDRVAKAPGSIDIGEGIEYVGGAPSAEKLAPINYRNIADKYFGGSMEIVDSLKDVLHSSSDPEMYIKNLKAFEDKLAVTGNIGVPKYKSLVKALKNNFEQAVPGYSVFDSRLNNIMSNFQESLLNVGGESRSFTSIGDKEKAVKKGLHEIIEGFVGDRAAQLPARARLAKLFDDTQGSLMPLFQNEAEYVSKLNNLTGKNYKVKFPGIGELPDKLVNDLTSTDPNLKQKATDELKKLILDYNDRIEKMSTQFNASEAVRGQPTDSKTGLERKGLSWLLGVGGETTSAISKGGTRLVARTAGHARNLHNTLDKAPANAVNSLAQKLEENGFKDIADIWRKSLDSRTGVSRNSALFITLSNPKYRKIAESIPELENEQLGNENIPPEE
jgi:hypothetical protein